MKCSYLYFLNTKYLRFWVKCIGLCFIKKSSGTAAQRLHKKKSLGTKARIEQQEETITTKRNQELENVFAELKV